ncbi:hypothetical protein CCP3SC15_6120001 [Gammaproteobacteria bacterium]
MALTCTLTKKSVTKMDSGIYIITATLACANGATEVINQNVSVSWNNLTNVTVAQAELQTKCQAIIDRYKAEQTIYTATALNNAISAIQTALVG